MELLPETRKKIRILVTQPYKEARLKVEFSAHNTPDGLVSFQPYTDTKHQHLRRLHHKAVQAVPEMKSATSQSSMQVPFSRWVATEPPEAAPDEDLGSVRLSAEVVERLMQGVEETSSVDVLGDDWGGLERKSHSQPTLSSSDQKSSMKTWTRTGEVSLHQSDQKLEDAEFNRPSREMSTDDQILSFDVRSDEHVDVLKLQAMQKKMVKRFHESRTAETASETRVERFFKHLQIHTQITDTEQTDEEDRNQ